ISATAETQSSEVLALIPLAPNHMTAWSIRGRCAADDGRHYNAALLVVHVEENAIAADPPSPGRRLSVEPHQVSTERLVLHLQQGGLNAFAVSFGNPSQLLLR